MSMDSYPIYEAPVTPRKGGSRTEETCQSHHDTMSRSVVPQKQSSYDASSRTAVFQKSSSLTSKTHFKNSSQVSMKLSSGSSDERILSDASVVRRKTSESLSSTASHQDKGASASSSLRQRPSVRSPEPIQQQELSSRVSHGTSSASSGANSLVQYQEKETAVSPSDTSNLRQDSADSLNSNPQSPRKLSISVTSDVDESFNNSSAPPSPPKGSPPKPIVDPVHQQSVGNSDSEEYSEDYVSLVQ